MSNSPYVSKSYGTTGGTIVMGADPYHVAKGFGQLFGGPAGAVPRDIIFEGGMLAYHQNGKNQSPIYSTRPSETILATGIVKASDTGFTRIDIVRGMEEAEFTRVSFRKFVNTAETDPLNPTIPSPADMTGRLYLAPPVNGVWPEAAAIIPETNLGGLFGYKTRRVWATEQMSEAHALYYRPVVGGPSTLTFIVSVWGMPGWRTNMPIPVPAP